MTPFKSYLVKETQSLFKSRSIRKLVQHIYFCLSRGQIPRNKILLKQSPKWGHTRKKVSACAEIDGTKPGQGPLLCSKHLWAPTVSRAFAGH